METGEQELRVNNRAGRPSNRESLLAGRIDTQVGPVMVLLRATAVWFTFFKVCLAVVVDWVRLRWIWNKLRGANHEVISKARRMRLAFEDLGPTYIKFG